MNLASGIEARMNAADDQWRAAWPWSGVTADRATL
jgi:hypothetical protein